MLSSISIARLYAVAAVACRPLDVPEVTTAGPAEELIRDYEADQCRRLTELVKKLRALSAPQPSAAGMGRRYRKAAEAFGEYFPFSDQKVRRICRENAIGAPSGHRFAQMIEGTWHVVEPEFAIWRERFERGEPAV
jgi:hypothetical protein